MTHSRPSTLTIILLGFVLFAFCVPEIAAFGAGNIPSFAFLEGKAFRHGDIEDTLQQLIKRSSSAGGGFALGALMSKGSKFGGLDIKRVYFGNWLRDYSQAVDIAGLKKLPLQTIINMCMVLGFLAHGYATNEFEVTEERLSVYLPAEHIDNPKGYGDGEDARKYHPKLRGPVDPMELEVDPRTGMKNYIANESGHWDTSKALVRRTLEQCIHLGRQHRSQGRKQDEYEAYKLLGQLLHTLEDFPAHSNFCELALVSLGYDHVFVHVGDHVRIQAPNGKWVAPLVTGTFGGSDFMHSLLGEATDHISQASVSDLNKEFSSARSKSNSGPDASSALRDLLFKLPGGSGGEMSREMEGVERIRAGPGAGGKKPEEMTPQELHSVLWQVLSFRDSVVKKIEKTIEKIPGLGSMIEKLMESISVFVFTTLEPYVKPLLQTASTGLATSSAEIINTHDQYEVFNDPRASDPTHSFLSKDHFNLILNEPAGQLAKIIVTHTVRLVVKAWDDNSVHVPQLAEDILTCLFHPDFHNPSSQVQREMMHYMHNWLKGFGHKQNDIIQRLSKDAVRNHRNIRGGGHGTSHSSGTGHGSGSSHVGGAGHNAGVQMQANLQGYLNHIPGVQQASSMLGIAGGHHGGKKDSGFAQHAGGEGLYAPTLGGYAAPPVTTGAAADFYGSGAGPASAGPPSLPDHTSHAGHHQLASHGGTPGHAPGFPGHATSSYPSASPGYPNDTGYAASQSPHLPNAGQGPASSYAPSYASGYAPSYASPPGQPPNFSSGPSFPGSAPSFPGSAPSFPGSAPSFPGSAPSFPNAPQHGEQSQYPPPSGYPPPGNNQYNSGGGGSGW